MVNKENKTVKKIIEMLGKSKYILLVVVVGVFLMLLPNSGTENKVRDKTGAEGGEQELREFTLEQQEKRMSQALSEVEGAGKVMVVLTLRSSSEQVLASDTRISSKTPRGETGDDSAESIETTVVVASGGGVQIPVTLKYIYPEYLGALIIAEGADNAEVRLELMRAVGSLTGLGSDKITVTKMKSAQ